MKTFIFFLKFGLKIAPTCAFSVFKRIIKRCSIDCSSANLILINNEIISIIYRAIYIFLHSNVAHIY